MTTIKKLVFSSLAASLLLVSFPQAQKQGKLDAYLRSLPKQALSAAERNDILYTREEEKLARDVYLVMHQLWGTQTFANIAKAEQQHMDLCKFLIDRYALKDPVVSDKIGAFSNQTLAGIFNALVLFGAQSATHAEVVGTFIEDLDIYDLDGTIRRTDNRDIGTVWQNLQKGSRNHMRAFYKLLVNRKLYYPGILISSAALKAIISSANEKGAVDENGKRL